MSDDRKRRSRHRSKGPVDRDRSSAATKMNREMRNTDATDVPDRDLRGTGREAIAQQQREQDFDQLDRDLSAGRSRA